MLFKLTEIFSSSDEPKLNLTKCKHCSRFCVCSRQIAHENQTGSLHLLNSVCVCFAKAARRELLRPFTEKIIAVDACFEDSFCAIFGRMCTKFSNRTQDEYVGRKTSKRCQSDFFQKDPILLKTGWRIFKGKRDLVLVSLTWYYHLKILQKKCLL
ncbi:hypothetical protein CDAR_378261 [Caerostris darwini]|uniref:Uncharacterized protein n=1 Tax=Caerostris darwini TaxID=1538125 RepID=A0AAV4T3J2_9ARAC|nr:hypothetical protein CDAR_378261 [Caerostris darwini]